MKFTFDQLLSFTTSADLGLFQRYFDGFARHLWRKFSGEYKFDLLVFYSSLGTENRAILEIMINDNF